MTKPKPPRQPPADGALSYQGHGSRACYVKGCTRAECRAANNAYIRAYRNGAHGTPQNRIRPYRDDKD